MVRNPTRTESQPDHLDAAVERLGRLPVLSATVRRVKAIADTEDAGIGEMVAALEADRAWRPTCCATRTRPSSARSAAS